MPFSCSFYKKTGNIYVSPKIKKYAEIYFHILEIK